MSAFVESLEPRELLAATMKPLTTIGPEPDRLLVTSKRQLYFVDYDRSISNHSLFHYNPAIGETIRLPGLDPGVGAQTVESGGYVYYSANSNSEIWITDGTANGSKMIFDHRPRLMTPFNGGVLFAASSGNPDGTELYFAKESKVAKVKEINPNGSSFPGGREFQDESGIFVVGNFAYFSADDGVHGAELWKTDGTAAGTVMLKDTNPSGPGYPRTILKHGKKIFFTAEDEQQDQELWISDGRAAGTNLFKEFDAPVNSDEPSLLASVGAYVYFTVGETSGLWRTDGTDEGTMILVDHVGPMQPTSLAGVLYFWDQKFDPQVSTSTLWRSDGTAAGTFALKTFADDGFFDRPMVSTGGRIYFPARESGDDATPWLLWQSDGTTAGTRILRTSDGTKYRDADNLAALGNKLFMTAANGDDIIGGADQRIFVVTDDGLPGVALAPGTISGIVFKDLDRDGVRDVEEPPLSGYRIFIDRNNDGICNRNELSARSSVTGRWSFADLPVGTYVVRQTPVESRLPTTPTSYIVKLAAGSRVVRSFGNVGGTISGMIFNDANANGVRNLDEIGVYRAQVWLDLNADGGWDEGEPIVRSLASGRYTFSDVIAGTYRIGVLDVPGMTFTAGNSRKVTLPAGGTITRYFGVAPM